MEGCEVKIVREPLKVPPAQFSLNDGAVVEFFGVVRALEKDEVIEGIDYEAFVEMAISELRKTAVAAKERFGLSSVTIYHRVGLVAAGEPSLFLRVASRHRQAAFAGATWIVERLKVAVPIWKHPVHSNVALA
jgi:molybdopterin synthase catalytic subunit